MQSSFHLCRSSPIYICQFRSPIKNINNICLYYIFVVCAQCTVNIVSRAPPQDSQRSFHPIISKNFQMAGYNIGKYTYYGEPHFLVHQSEIWTSDLKNHIKTFDRILHRSLVNIFRQHCLNIREKIKEFLHGYRHNTDQASIIEPILEQEPLLSKCFSKNEFKKFSLLWIAVLAGYHDSAELLIRSGADVNAIFGYRNPQVIHVRCSILHLLLYRDYSPENERLVRLLMGHGANLEARDFKGRTALHCAVYNGHTEITRMLLKKGADISAKDASGETALFYMTMAANVTLEERFDMVRILIENGFSPNEKDKEGYQPIHRAIERGLVQLVEVLLDLGADPNAQLDGVPLMHFTIGKDPYCLINKRVLEMLLKHGANIDLITTEGDTVLHRICAEEPHNLPELLEIVLFAGADVLAQNFFQETPYDILRTAQDMLQKRYRGAKILIKAMVVKKALDPTIELKDEDIIVRNPETRKYYRQCLKEIDKIKSMKGFIRTCTFFELLTKSQRKIAALMLNPDFEKKFKLFNLNARFPIYAEDLLKAFRGAQSHYHSMLELENLINEAVYNTLPYVVVTKIVRYITTVDFS